MTAKERPGLCLKKSRGAYADPAPKEDTLDQTVNILRTKESWLAATRTPRGTRWRGWSVFLECASVGSFGAENLHRIDPEGSAGRGPGRKQTDQEQDRTGRQVGAGVEGSDLEEKALEG